ncbi:MAG: cupin domain-containing protein [Gammaproteobacteria bacterium]|jgi:quercetin dioxygenase-like cupin family protein|nr:cupin domain-containing protein [Gammaproteobacteria bacterium]
MAPKHVVNRLDECAVDANATFGSCVWQTLFGKDDQSSDLSLGYATFPPHGTLLQHRHDDAEFYFCTRGSGKVIIEGSVVELAVGVSIMIPGSALHEVVAGADGLEFVYGFPNQPYFSQVNYEFVERDMSRVA